MSSSNIMITNFEFRPIVASLTEQIKEFHIHLFGEKNAFLFGTAFVSGLLAGSLAKTLILFEKNKKDIVGISCFQLGGYIHSFGIHSKYRGIGLGKYLLQCTIACYLDIGDKNMALNVNTGNHVAIKLYQKFGFKITYTIHGFYGNRDSHGPDAHDMTMDISNLSRCVNSKIRNKLINFTAKQSNCIYRINGLLVAIEPFCK